MIHHFNLKENNWDWALPDLLQIDVCRTDYQGPVMFVFHWELPNRGAPSKLSKLFPTITKFFKTGKIVEKFSWGKTLRIYIEIEHDRVQMVKTDKPYIIQEAIFGDVVVSELIREKIKNDLHMIAVQMTDNALLYSQDFDGQN